jgi:hypothetical protein
VGERRTPRAREGGLPARLFGIGRRMAKRRLRELPQFVGFVGSRVTRKVDEQRPAAMTFLSGTTLDGLGRRIGPTGSLRVRTSGDAA